MSSRLCYLRTAKNRTFQALEINWYEIDFSASSNSLQKFELHYLWVSKIIISHKILLFSGILFKFLQLIMKKLKAYLSEWILQRNNSSFGPILSESISLTLGMVCNHWWLTFFPGDFTLSIDDFIRHKKCHTGPG